MRSLSLLGIVVQGLQKAPLVWTLIILGIVVQTSGIGICREDFWVLWSTISPQSSSPRLPRALKALPMDDQGAFTADCSRERPSLDGDDERRRKGPRLADSAER